MAHNNTMPNKFIKRRYGQKRPPLDAQKRAPFKYQGVGQLDFLLISLFIHKLMNIGSFEINRVSA